MFSYEGKKAIVTGAGRGIGRATALAFARQGADVSLAARTADEIESAADEIRRLGRRAWAVTTDMSDLEQAESLIHQANRAMGGIDILVNNAGGASNVPGGVGPVEQTTPDAFESLFSLNVKSPLFASLRAAEYMKQQGTGGSILNIVSIDGLSPTPGTAVYGSAKAALVSLTETLAIELGNHNIRVNAIAPGLIDTKLGGVGTGDERVDKASFYTINRVGAPEDIAAAAVYLCSDEAGWISGATLLATGGQQTAPENFRWLRSVNPVPEGTRI